MLDAEGFQFLELPVARLRVGQDQVTVVVQRLTQPVGVGGIEWVAIVTACPYAGGIDFAEELVRAAWRGPSRRS